MVDQTDNIYGIPKPISYMVYQTNIIYGIPNRYHIWYTKPISYMVYQTEIMYGIPNRYYIWYTKPISLIDQTYYVLSRTCDWRKYKFSWNLTSYRKDDLYFLKNILYFCNMIFTEITQIGANKLKETDGRFDVNIC